MNQIYPYPIWVGHAGDGRAFQDVFGKEIRAIVQLAAEEPALAPPRDLIVYRFPLLDGAGNDPDLLHLLARNGIFANVSKLTISEIRVFANCSHTATYVSTQLAHFCEQVAGLMIAVDLCAGAVHASARMSYSSSRRTIASRTHPGRWA
jgi:hypothetical protein